MQITPFIAGKRAIAVYPSDNTEIPFPAVVASGNNDAAATDTLTDTTANFNTLGVAVGDIVYNTTAGLLASATVTSITSDTVLGLSSDIFTNEPQTYVIYTSNLESGNDGCAIYIGGQGAAAVTLKVITMGGDTVVFSVQKGTILPCLVTKVFSTGTTAALDLIALWQ